MKQRSIEDLTNMIEVIHQQIIRAAGIGNKKLELLLLKRHNYLVHQRYQKIKKGEE